MTGIKWVLPNPSVGRSELHWGRSRFKALCDYGFKCVNWKL